MNLRQSVIGVDPGNPGAAVMLDHRGRLVFVAVWKGNQRKRVRGYQLTVYIPGAGVQQDQLPRRESVIGGHLAALLDDLGIAPELLACEDVFLHRQKPNLKTTVSLARFGGSLTSPLELVCNTGTDFTHAHKWRSAVLGISPYTKRATAKAASLRSIPPQVPGLADALEELGPLDHITDAAGVALWRQRTAAHSAA